MLCGKRFSGKCYPNQHSHVKISTRNTKNLGRETENEEAQIRWVRGKKVRWWRCVAMCGEDRGPIVPAYSSRRRPKINICSKEFQHIFPFGTDQRKATGNLLFVLKSSEAIIETFPKTMSS